MVVGVGGVVGLAVAWSSMAVVGLMMVAVVYWANVFNNLYKIVILIDTSFTLSNHQGTPHLPRTLTVPPKFYHGVLVS